MSLKMARFIPKTTRVQLSIYQGNGSFWPEKGYCTTQVKKNRMVQLTTEVRINIFEPLLSFCLTKDVAKRRIRYFFLDNFCHAKKCSELTVPVCPKCKTSSELPSNISTLSMDISVTDAMCQCYIGMLNLFSHKGPRHPKTLPKIEQEKITNRTISSSNVGKTIFIV